MGNTTSNIHIVISDGNGMDKPRKKSHNIAVRRQLSRIHDHTQRHTHTHTHTHTHGLVLLDE